MELSRRTFLRRAAGYALVPAGVSGLVAACERLGERGRAEARAEDAAGREGPGPDPGYGPLLEPRDGSPLALPRGFRVRAFGRVGEPMTDGRPTPIAHDGMAAFAFGAGVRLVRNHEDRNPAGYAEPIGGGVRPYDPLGGGGTTTLELDAGGRLVASFVSLEGTIVNCAGGPTPWGSWLSCEEATAGPLEGFERPHGYVFEVPVDADGPADPEPIRAMGRFRHEAVAVDPETGTVYMTEDNDYSADGLREEPGSGFYRYRPERPGHLREGGRLEMLRVPGRDRARLFEVGDVLAEFPVEWVPIPEPDPPEADSLTIGVRDALVFLQGMEEGAAAFRRLEGCWFSDGRVYFHDTRGGPARRGHVWQYDPARERLTLLFVSPGVDVLDSPDNITVSPWGDIVICEDGGGSDRLRVLTPEGRIFDLARNALNSSEFAGATFGPDGRTLFVNIQGSTAGRPERAEPGVTLAIDGPWRETAQAGQPPLRPPIRTTPSWATEATSSPSRV